MEEDEKMTYSVWDHADRIYKYYQTPEKSTATNAPKPKHLRSTALGMSPEQAAWPLPSNAHMVGKGKYPKGFIASKKSGGGLGLGIIPDSPTKLLLYGVIGYFAYDYWKKNC